MMKIAQLSGSPVTSAKALPPSTAFDAKNPRYMKTTSTTTSRLPSEPNCARVWSIWGTPICGPCAACSAMTTPPTRLPATTAIAPAQKGSPNTVVASAPVMIVSSMMFEPNHTVKMSRARPCRSSCGMWSMVRRSTDGAAPVDGWVDVFIGRYLCSVWAALDRPVRVCLAGVTVCGSERATATASGLFSKYRGDQHHRENRKFRTFTSREQMTSLRYTFSALTGSRTTSAPPYIDQTDVERQINRRCLIYRASRFPVTIES